MRGLAGVKSLISPLGKLVVGFAGIGGWCFGASLAWKAPEIAVNHWDYALQQHAANHPTTLHLREDVYGVNMRSATLGELVAWMHISPDCTHHSKAKGSRPRDLKRRALAQVLVQWASEAPATIISLENVIEFLDWGPLDKRGYPIASRAGELFRAFIADLQALGYHIEWRELCGADYGAPTTRTRLFLMGRRDGNPIVWPEPTHGEGRPLPWRTAGECIDWSDPTNSIFGRPKPLAEATQRRMALGIIKHLLTTDAPYLAPAGAAMISQYYGSKDGQQHHCLRLDQPLPTITTWDHHALVTGHLTKLYGSNRTGSALDQPVPTVTATGQHLGLVTASVAGLASRAPATADEVQPVWTAGSPTSTSACANRDDLVAASLIKFYKTGGQSQALTEPLHTITCTSRFAVVVARLGDDLVGALRVGKWLRKFAPDAPVAWVTINGRRRPIAVVITPAGVHLITDVGMRMLRPRELARAQGFPDTFQLSGTQRDQIAGIGNSVVPQIAAALVRANIPTLRHGPLKQAA